MYSHHQKKKKIFLTTLKEEEKTLIINNITNVSPGGSSRKRPLEHIASNDNLNEMDGNLKKIVPGPLKKAKNNTESEEKNDNFDYR